MMNKKKSLVIIVVFLLMVVCIVVTALICLNIDKFKTNTKKELENGQKEDDVQSKENDNTEDADFHSKYSFMEWAAGTYKITDFVEIEIDKTKLVFTEQNGEKNEIDVNAGNLKGIMAYISGGAFKVEALTESGKVYIIDYIEKSVVLIDSLNDYNIIDMGKSPNNLFNYNYYLTSDGKLINYNGDTYEDINKDFVNVYGSLSNRIYIDKKGYLYYHESEMKYIPLVDEEGNNIEASQIFLQSSSTRNDLIKENVTERFIIVSNNGKMYYYDDNKLNAAYQVEQGKKVLSFEYKALPEEYGGTITSVEFKMSDNSIVKFVDVLNLYYDANKGIVNFD